MVENRDVKIRKKARPELDTVNKEQASNKNKKKRWHKNNKRPQKDLGESLQELQTHINDKYHTS